ncbi:hypothetical protein GCM10010412_000420 [Nonomuraea recticatena]|uniref:Uncharacterized protein n=1 Tax=Nonomuraea recticatena TaxID=46178 RepID=A0ABN3R213_9ACTN
MGAFLSETTDNRHLAEIAVNSRIVDWIERIAGTAPPPDQRRPLAGRQRELVLSLAGRPAQDPQAGLDAVEPRHIAWHGRQVFRTPARLP